MVVDAKWIMLAFIWVVCCISRWGRQMIIVTLVFESFEENINMIFWGSLLLTNEEKWQFNW